MKQIAIYIFLFFFSQTVYNQEPSRAGVEEKIIEARQLGAENLEEGIFLLDSLEEVSKQSFGENDSLTALVVYTKGALYYNNNFFQKSIPFIESSLAIRKKAFPDSHPLIARTEYVLGQCYRKSNNLKKAITHILKSIDLRKKYDTDEVYRSYGLLATVYSQQGEFSLAEKYYQLAINNANDNTKKTGYYIDLIVLSFTQGLPDKANSFIVEFKEEMRQDKQSLTELSFVLGGYYDDKGELTNAIDQYQKTEEMLLELEDFENLSYLYNDMAITYQKKGEKDKAIQFINKAIHLNIEYYGSNNNPELAVNYHNLADIYSAKRNKMEALKSNHLAIQQLIPFYQSQQIYSNLDIKKMPIIGLKYEALVILDSLGSNYKSLFLETKERKNIDAAINVYEQAIVLIDIMRSEHIEEGSMLFWRNEARKVYERAFECALLAGRPELAFFFCEKSKAAILLDALNKAEATNLAPNDLIQKEINLRTEIADLELAQTNSGQPDTLLQELIEQKDNQRALIKEIEESYPKYFHYKYDIHTVSIPEIQSSILDNKTSLVEYFFINNILYAFVITKDSFRLEKISNDTSLINKVSNLITVLGESELIQTNTGFQSFMEVSLSLYNDLIRPLKLNSSRLIIIPDGILNYVPFGSLVTSVPEGEKLPFFLLEQAISYSYSSTIFGKNQSRKNKHNKQLLAIAPMNFEAHHSPLAPLAQSNMEVDGVLSNFEGKKLIEEQATKPIFLNEAKQYGVLHISSHASADVSNEQIPWIALYDTLLYLPQIYNLDLNAEMVVLSACETSKGDLKKGEGVMSVARGFAYAGVPSTITTLWEVEEKATAIIMESFYRYLKKGFRKDKALKHSKLDYINNVSDSPSEWAAFILVGNADSIQLEHTANYLLFLFLLIPIVLFVGYRIRKNVF